MQACNPSSAAQGNNAAEKTFHKLVEQSEWLVLLQAVIQLAGAVTDLMDIQGSSVMLCLEDGWDLTCQVSSLAQLCLDPYYRTIAGFSDRSLAIVQVSLFFTEKSSAKWYE